MILLYAAGAYLLGSIPVAWLLTKAVTGRDLRQMGSGNVGVTNVGLNVARWAGLVVFTAELAKGVAAVLIPGSLGAGELETYVAVVMAIVGTRWPVWLGFHGGRGNSVGFGALTWLSWQTFAIGLAVWIVARLALRSSFWAARVCMVVWPVVFGLMMSSWWALIFGVLVALIYLSTHHEETDDHMIIKERWPSILAFLFSPPRR